MSLQEEVTTENDISEVPVVSTTTSSALYDRKHHSKAIRVLTVLAYVLSVSLAAILLSIYYIFVWDGHPTMAARSYLQVQTALNSESLQVKGFQDIARKRDTLNIPIVNNSMENESVQEVVVKYTVKSEKQTKCEETENKDQKENTSQIFGEHSFFNNSGNSTTWMVVANSSNLDEFRIGLPIPEGTMDYEDSTNYTTPPSDENSTWFSELDDFNSDYGMLNKRSVFMKKLLGHHHAMPK